MTATALAAVGSNANENGTLLISGTAVTLTNQTAPELSTTIPSWVKRITVIFNGISQSSSSPFGIVQIGSGSYSTSGYVNTASLVTSSAATSVTSITTGFIIYWTGAASDTASGHLVLTLISGNSWVASGVIANSGTARILTTAGNITLGGVLDRIRLTTQDGTTQYDAGTVNIFWE